MSKCILYGLCVALLTVMTLTACGTSLIVTLPHQNEDGSTLTNLAQIVVYMSNNQDMSYPVKKADYDVPLVPNEGDEFGFEYTPDIVGYIALKSRNTLGVESRGFSNTLRVDIPNSPMLFQIKVD